MAAPPPISRAVLDGVPTFWSPRDGAGNGYSAGIVFRAGILDGRLDTAGVAHLVEHLVLPSEAD